MAIIYTFPDLGSVDGTEKLLVSDGNDENNTKTVTTAAYGAYINATYGGGGGSSIYQADGSITANRQLSGSSLYSLTFTSLTGFTLDTTTNIALNPTTTVDIGEGKGITTANTTGTVEAIKDRNVANNYIKWLSRSLGTNGDDLILSGAYGVSVIANNAIAGVNITNGASGKLTITNGVPTLIGSNNDIADITAAASKALITKEWAIDYIANWAGSTNITTLGTITTGTWNGTAISPIYGGTGQTGYSAGDMLYADGVSSLDRLSIGGANTVLVSNGSLPSWGGINNNYWSGTALSAANGGTGQAGGYTIGDILYANSVTTLAKLPAGATAGHVLTSNGAGVAPSYKASPSAANIYNADGTISGTRTIINGGNLRFTGTGLGTTTTFDNKAGYGFTNNASVTVDASAVVQIDSTTKGVLLPRMTTTQINAISSPATGLMAYNTTLNQICFYNGTAWRKVTDTAM